MKIRNWKVAGCTFLLLLLAFVLGATPAGAQLSGKGTIQGTVTDKTGAVIPGATVTIVSNETGFKAIRTTTSSGDYDVSVDPGTYTITVGIKGFKSLKQQNVNVNALEKNEVNLQLQTGAVTETITVTDAPPTLNTTDASMGATMEQEMYSALPVLQQADQRRATDFATLMPGVQGNETNGNATTNTGVVNGSGSRGAASEVYINGLPFTSTAGEGDPRFVWTAISVDSINQFQVQTAGYSAVYQGQGVQNYVIKSGTNKIHGTLFDYFRNTALDTWGFFGVNNVNPLTGKAVKPVEHQNEYGIFAGFPIFKDKLFFFGNYNGYRYSKPVFTTLTVPSVKMQGGDFSEWAGYAANPAGQNTSNKYAIYDPSTNGSVTTLSPNGRTQFVSGTNYNVIPTTKWDPVAKLMNADLAPYQNYIIPYTSSNVGSGNLPWTQPTGLSNWSTTEHLDWQINPKHYVSFIFAAGRQASVGPAAASFSTSSGVTSGNSLPAPFMSSQVYAPKTKVLIFEDNYVINDKLVNQFKYGFGRYFGPSFNVDTGGAFAASTLGIHGLPAGQAASGFPITKFSSGNLNSFAGYTGNVQATNTYSLIDNLQWNISKHSITLGGMIEWMQYNYQSVTTGTTPLTLTFAPADTSNFSSGTTLSTTLGQAYASFLIGQFNSASVTQNAVIETAARFRPISPYIQDDWKVSKKLTLNVGLRWDFYPSFTEAQNRVSWLNPNLPNPLTGNNGMLQFAGNVSAANPGGCNCSSPVSNSHKQFGPRLGLAYQITPKTVLRASYGVFYTHGNAVGGSSTSRQGSGQLGWSSSVSPADTATLPAGTLSTFVFTPPASSLTTGFGSGYTSTVTTAQKVTYADPYYGGRSPQYINWSIGIQRELTPRTTLTVSYVGSEGHFEISDSGNARGMWTNQLDPKYLALGATNLNFTATPANFTTAGVSCPFTSATCLATRKIYQFLTPFPQYNGVSDPYGNVSNSNYHALQVSAIQRPGNGLTFMINYTWSKAIDDGGTFRSGYAIPAIYAQTTNNWKADRMDRSLSTSNQPQHLVVTGVWDMPFAKTRGDSLGHVLYHDVIGGWKFSEILQAYSGSPLPITGASSACGTNPAQSQCMPTLNPAWTSKTAMMNGGWGHGVTAANYTQKSFINQTAFTATPAYMFGNAARTAPYGIYGPGNYQLDISLRRTFPIYKRASLLFEGDMFNVTNHTFFAVSAGSLAYTNSTTNMGSISGINSNSASRDMQFAAKLQF
jgi:hypothetical protein